MANGTYIVLRKGKRLVNPGPGHGRVLPLVWIRSEVKRLKNKPGCFTVVNLKTQKKTKMGAACPAPKRKR